MANDTKAAQEAQKSQRDTRAAMGTALASAGEHGVGGNSVGQLAMDYAGQEAQQRADIEFNRQMADSEIMWRMKGSKAQAQDRINSVRPANPMATMLQIGSAAVSAGSTYYTLTSPRLNPNGTMAKG